MIKCIVSESYFKDNDLFFVIYFSVESESVTKYVNHEPKTLNIAKISSNATLLNHSTSHPCVSSSKKLLKPQHSFSNNLSPTSAILSHSIDTRRLNKVFRSYSQLLELKNRLIEINSFESYLDLPEPPDLLLCHDLLYLERKRDQIDRWLEIICFRLDLTASQQCFIDFLYQKTFDSNTSSKINKFIWFNLSFKKSKEVTFLKIYSSFSDYVDWDQDLYDKRCNHLNKIKNAYLNFQNALDLCLTQTEDVLSSKSVVFYDLKELFEFNILNSGFASNLNHENLNIINKKTLQKNMLINLEILSKTQKILNQRDIEMILFQKNKVFDPVNEILKFCDSYTKNLNIYTISLAKYNKLVVQLAEIDERSDELSLSNRNSSYTLLKNVNQQSLAKDETERSQEDFRKTEQHLHIETFYFEKFRYCMLQKALANYIKSQAINARKKLDTLKKSLASLRKNKPFNATFKPSTRIGNLMLAQDKTVFPSIETFKDTKIRRIGYYKESATLSLDAKIRKHTFIGSTASLSTDNIRNSQSGLYIESIGANGVPLFEGNLCEVLNQRFEYELSLDFPEQSLFKAYMAGFGLLPKESILPIKSNKLVIDQNSSNSTNNETQKLNLRVCLPSESNYNATTSKNPFKYTSTEYLNSKTSIKDLIPHPSISSISTKVLSINQHPSSSCLNLNEFVNSKHNYDYNNFQNNATIN
ncbi:hypothetical protein BB561_002092 [Smittium simulii]|uniref:PX domain-containing protein n=1 Tax=Smittium simulii TaxID=133385 RepID=A0A2T9YRQ6_9FUNG|nr:hypothetical protein BB561_002092 [Smittium simulii]